MVATFQSKIKMHYKTVMLQKKSCNLNIFIFFQQPQLHLVFSLARARQLSQSHVIDTLLSFSFQNDLDGPK